MAAKADFIPVRFPSLTRAEHWSHKGTNSVAKIGRQIGKSQVPDPSAIDWAEILASRLEIVDCN